MIFHNPAYLLLLLLVIPIIVWYVKRHHKVETAMKVPTFRQFRGVYSSSKVRYRHLPFILRVVAIIMLIVVLARPQTSRSWQSSSTQGIDVMMTMDISGTMLAEDLKPNRLKAAKNVAIEFVKGRPNDNIGLVLFAGESFTQCPLTTDHDVLINLFNSVDFGMIEDGTAIGSGLANALSRLKESKSKSKVIILLTDGSNNAGDIAPETAAEIAYKMGVRIYAIGVGTRGKAPFPFQTQMGVQYQNIDVDIDENMLKSIAQRTGGAYFRATDNETLKNIYAQIDQMEKTKLDVNDYGKRNEAYAPFAILALLCVLGDVILRKTVFEKLP